MRAELIQSYYDACNSGEVERVAACFTPDAVHYYTRFSPDRGRDDIASHWAKLVRDLEAHWTVDRVIEQGDDACIEWSMTWRGPGGEDRVDHGTEWYSFEGDLISEIRCYHHTQPDNRSGALIGYERAA